MNMNEKRTEIELHVHELKYSVVQRIYTQLCIHLDNNNWTKIRINNYWNEKDKAPTEFEKRKVTLIYFALHKDKLDYDTLYKIHNDYEEFNQLKSMNYGR